MKKAAVINDLSSFGKCSLTAAIPILSVMGVQPCPLPTAVLSGQSELPVFFCEDLTFAMPRYRDAWKAANERFDGICTGYFAGGRQLDEALAFLDCFQNDDTLVLVDPVMGDNGRLYPVYDAQACQKMRRLAQQAHVITPNLTELCILTETDFTALTAHSGDGDYLDRIAEIAAPWAENRDVVVTGIRAGTDICNLVLHGGNAATIRAKRAGESFSGTGDIFAAVVFGCMLNGKTAAQAAQTAADFVKRSVLDTMQAAHNPKYGVNFEKFLITLSEVI